MSACEDRMPPLLCRDDHHVFAIFKLIKVYCLCRLLSFECKFTIELLGQ